MILTYTLIIRASSTLDADTQTSTLDHTPRRLHWIRHPYVYTGSDTQTSTLEQVPRGLHWIRHPDVSTGSDTQTSTLDQTPRRLHWIRQPDVSTGSDTQTSPLDQTPRRLHWIRHPDVSTGSDTQTPGLQEPADVAYSWTTPNDMKINQIKKNNLLLIFKTRKDLQPMHINGTETQRVTEANVLGITIISNLTWDVHV